MIKPKITIITATYYRPDLLARAIKSVQRSTFKEYEHIIVSDHCPKAQQVYDIFKEDKRIKFFEQEPPHTPNQGARAHNFAIEKKAKTDLFCYLGDDNIILPNFLEVMYNALTDGSHDGIFTKTYTLPIKKGDGGVLSILSRNFDHDINPEKYVLDDIEIDKCPRDIGNFGHTRRLFEKAGSQILVKDRHSEGSEDCLWFGQIDTQVLKGRVKVKDLHVFTGVYYGRSACRVRDEDYHNKVKGLKEDEVFVYPEILKKNGII